MARRPVNTWQQIGPHGVLLVPCRSGGVVDATTFRPHATATSWGARATSRSISCDNEAEARAIGEFMALRIAKLCDEVQSRRENGQWSTLRQGKAPEQEAV